MGNGHFWGLIKLYSYIAIYSYKASIGLSTETACLWRQTFLFVGADIVETKPWQKEIPARFNSGCGIASANISFPKLFFWSNIQIFSVKNALFAQHQHLRRKRCIWSVTEIKKRSGNYGFSKNQVSVLSGHALFPNVVQRSHFPLGLIATRSATPSI